MALVGHSRNISNVLLQVLQTVTTSTTTTTTTTTTTSHRDDSIPSHYHHLNNNNNNNKDNNNDNNNNNMTTPMIVTRIDRTVNYNFTRLMNGTTTIPLGEEEESNFSEWVLIRLMVVLCVLVGICLLAYGSYTLHRRCSSGHHYRHRRSKHYTPTLLLESGKGAGK